MLKLCTTLSTSYSTGILDSRSTTALVMRGLVEASSLGIKSRAGTWRHSHPSGGQNSREILQKGVEWPHLTPLHDVSRETNLVTRQTAATFAEGGTCRACGIDCQAVVASLLSTKLSTAISTYP